MNSENVLKMAKSPGDSMLGMALDHLSEECHKASYAAGWWHHANTGLPYIPGDSTTNGVSWSELDVNTRSMIEHYWPMFIACKIALIHSEISEGMEAHRKGEWDDKLAHRLGLETELADAMIRQFDLAGAMQRAASLGVVDPTMHRIALGGAVQEKRSFNRTRPDHTISARTATGGKKY